MPASRVLAPQLRFLWQRVTPGGLGIELTTALAITAVGSFAFVLTLDDVMDPGYRGPTGFDRRVADMVDQIHSSIGVDIAKIVTHLGDAPIVYGMVGAASVLLVWRRRPYELLTLLIGTALVYAGVHITKDAVDRPRVADPLVETMGSSFPSGHAAYAVAVYGLVAWLAYARGHRGLAGALALPVMLMGPALALLGNHYPADILAGYALGLGWLLLVLVAAERLRLAGPEDAATPGH
jgi:undecaprenyl-diphosphatase